MDRWIYGTEGNGTFQQHDQAEAFLKDLQDVCRNHNLSLAHEDGHGAFIVEAFNEENLSWLNNAHVDL